MGGGVLPGIEAFEKVFGDITILSTLQFVLAVVFIVLVYKKISDYLLKSHDEKKERDKELKEALEAVKRYPEYRKQSLDIQKDLDYKIKYLQDAQQDIVSRIDKMEQNFIKTERNRLRENIISSYRYYTNKEKNPMQAWTRMESEAFWEVFSDYEDHNGDGYVHTVVQPAMNLLYIIEMEDEESLSELAKSRK